MFHVKHKNIYKLLFNLALKSLKNNDVPVGAIVVYNNEIIGKGYNTRQSKCDVCGHAEVNAIRNAEKKMGDWRLDDCILITTLKPCEMCHEIIKSSRIKNVYYYIDQQSVSYKIDENYIKFDSIDAYLIKYSKIFKNFFKKLR